MKEFDFRLMLNLFDGEGAAAGSAAAPGGTGENGAASGVSAQPTEQKAAGETASTEDLNAEFDSLIKGKFKDLYDKRVQGVIKERFKKYDGVEKANKQMQKTLSLIGQRYGTEDASELYDKISKDASLFEAQALEAGMSEEAFLDKKRVEFENKQLLQEIAKRDEDERNREVFRQWQASEAELQKIYPSFNLQAELSNERFGRLLASGVDMRTVYEVVHHDEVVRSVAANTAAAVAEKQASVNALNAKRPTESGLSSQAGVTKTNDVTKLTREERKKLAERARRGEQISFS